MKPTIGLALGGGGARGWAHIGIIRALEEADISTSYLAGTSIGALVGAIYAVGALDELEAFADEVNMREMMQLVDISFPSLGLISGERIRDFIARYLLDNAIEDAHVPFQCVATNFLLKEEVILQTGLMVDAVRASISIPGIFAPCKRAENLYLVDGGVVNPVPVSVVEAMGADYVIAVNLNKEPKQSQAATDQPDEDRRATQASESSGSQAESESAKQPDKGPFQRLSNRYEALKDVVQDQVDDWIPDPSTGLNIFDVLGNSINVMEQRVTEINLQIHQPQCLIEPDLSEFGLFDFHQAKPMIEIGYQAAQAKLPHILQAVSSN